jgi:hypothetical protein
MPTRAGNFGNLGSQIDLPLPKSIERAMVGTKMLRRYRAVASNCLIEHTAEALAARGEDSGIPDQRESR